MFLKLELINQGVGTVGYCRYRQAVPVGIGGRLDVDTNFGLRKSFLPQVPSMHILLFCIVVFWFIYRLVWNLKTGKQKIFASWAAHSSASIGSHYFCWSNHCIRHWSPYKLGYISYEQSSS